MTTLEILFICLISALYLIILIFTLFIAIKTAILDSKNAFKHYNNKNTNFLKKLWNYFTTYEKLWLIVLFTAGITISILFPDEEGWLQAVSIITLLGGCSCELLLSKQSKWCFVVSFFFYDLTQTIIYFANGYYVSALYELLILCPLLWVSFFLWNKHQDKDNQSLTEVKKINLKRDLAIFIGVLVASLATGIIFSTVGGIFEGLSDYWYIDALANTFSICNALFMVFRFKEQWLPWYGVIACETVMWIISGNWVMLILQLGYITNTVYGSIVWARYVKKHSDNSESKLTSDNFNNISNESVFNTDLDNVDL